MSKFPNNTKRFVHADAKKPPQVSGILKDRLNLKYKASVDANTIHRALHILKAGPDLSGDYTCQVSTMESEDTMTKSMLVFGKWFFYSRLKKKNNNTLFPINYGITFCEQR